MKRNEIIFVCICLGLFILDFMVYYNNETETPKERIIYLKQECESLKQENLLLNEYIKQIEEDNSIMGSLLAEKENKKKVNKSKFKFVPGSNSVYRSSQPTLKELSDFLSKHNVSTVIRMNDTEGTGVTVKQERELVQSMGKHFLWVNAHEGYQKGKGYIESIELVQPFLEHGNVLIHCTAGKDRTGYMVGYYLLNHLGWDRDSVWDYTVGLNEWEKFISEGRKGYIKYMEAFYPYEDWKRIYKK